MQEQVKLWAVELVGCLDRLHRAGFVFVDLKPENILLLLRVRGPSSQSPDDEENVATYLMLLRIFIVMTTTMTVMMMMTMTMAMMLMAST